MGCGGGNREAEVDVWLCCISFVCEQRAQGCGGLGNTWETSGAFTKGGAGLGPSTELCPPAGILLQICELLSKDPCFWLESCSHLSWKGHPVPLPCSEWDVHSSIRGSACFPASVSLVLPLEQSCIELKLPELFVNRVSPFWPTSCCLAQQPHFQRLCANLPSSI